MMANRSRQGDESPGVIRDRIALVSGAALLAAGLILVCAVFPAEFGVDPLGVGRWLGLTALGEVEKNLEAFEATRAAGTSAGGAPTIGPQDRAYQHEKIDFNIEPRGSMEYKYRLDKGEALLYSWKATAPVHVEFHAEPDGAPKGYAETYEKKDGLTTASGTLTAPFSGIHGWYWENTTDKPITVTLSAAGFYNMSHEFRKNAPIKTNMY
jgi:hypothetical protein